MLPIYKIVVLGDGGVGKTALTIQLFLNHFVETYDPTIEDSYRKQVIIDNQLCLLEVLDTAGQDEYTALRHHWIRDGEGFLLVYAITDNSTFQRIERFKEEIFRVKEKENMPLMLVGNKSDREDRQVTWEEGVQMAKEMKCEFMETSAKLRLNVENAFCSVARMIREERKMAPKKVKVKRKRCNIL
ncbi:small GTPase superfamily [Phycomyces nitens]|nr:small GTPase superfamily [Phycomyces nitens]